MGGTKKIVGGRIIKVAGSSFIADGRANKVAGSSCKAGGRVNKVVGRSLKLFTQSVLYYQFYASYYFFAPKWRYLFVAMQNEIGNAGFVLFSFWWVLHGKGYIFTFFMRVYE